MHGRRIEDARPAKPHKKAALVVLILLAVAAIGLGVTLSSGQPSGAPTSRASPDRGSAMGLPAGSNNDATSQALRTAGYAWSSDAAAYDGAKGKCVVRSQWDKGGFQIDVVGGVIDTALRGAIWCKLDDSSMPAAQALTTLVAAFNRASDPNDEYGWPHFGQDNSINTTGIVVLSSGARVPCYHWDHS